MAKNKVEVDIIIDDKGNMKKVARDANKAGEGLDKAGQSSDNYSKKQKGVANATSNSTKAFSKMSGGMGGLVGAYASFAAQMFALTAAFGFLKRAGDLAVLQQGQTAYASATGIAMKTLTGDIIAATNAQVNFTDASQAAAIGTAAGLSTQQLTKLGTAAKDVSAVLGRDVTDSFNRLIRGVTKAEPELLDELGIILRLDTASENYARTLGKSAKSLSTFEKSQAVANEVLAQAEDKYSRILAVTGSSPNQFNQLGKALNDVIMTIQTGLMPVANAFAKVLTDIPLIAGAAFGLLLTGPLKAMGFNLQDIAVKAAAAAEAQTIAYNRAKLAADAATVSIQGQKAALVALAAQASAGGASGVTVQRVAGGDATGVAFSTMRRSAEAALKSVDRAGMVTKGVFKGVAASIVKDMVGAYKLMDDAANSSASTQTRAALKVKAGWAGLSNVVVSFTSKLIEFGSKLLRWAGYLGIAITLFQIIKNALGWETVLSDNEKALEATRKRVAELNEELREFIKIQDILTEDRDAVSGRALGAAIGARISSVTEEQMAQIRKDAASVPTVTVRGKRVRPGTTATSASDEEKEAALKFINDQIKAVELLNERFGETGPMNAYKEALKDENMGAEAFNQARVNAQELTTVMAGLPALTKESDNAFKSLINSLSPMNTRETVLEKMNAELDSLKKIQAARFADGTQIGTRTQADKDAEGKIIALQDQIKFTDKLNTLEHIAVLSQKELVRELTAANNLRADPVTKGLAVAQAKANVELDKYNSLTRTRDSLIKTMSQTEKTASDEAKKAQKRQLNLLNANIAAQEDARDVADAKLKIDTDMYELRLKIYNLGISTNFLDREKELLSISKKMLEQEKERIGLLEKERTREMNRGLRDQERGSVFGYMGAEKREAEANYKLENDLFATKKKFIEDERELKLKMVAMEYQLLEAKRMQTELELRSIAADPEGIYNDTQSAEAGRLAELFAGQRDLLKDSQSSAESLIRSSATSSIEDLIDNLTKLSDAKDDLQDISVLQNGIARSFEENFTSAFQSLVEGTKSAKQAFADMAMAILKDIASMITRMLVFRMLSSAFGGGGGNWAEFGYGDMSGDPFARQGGVFSAGKAVPGYATGGVARGPGAGYPAILHGTEAVVPLPNGRSIPVEMQNNGGGQTQNNVVVNVNTDGSTSTSESSGRDMDNLGAAIARAVQQELQAQKRSGGILNPYGVA